jgi:polysaccharide biosynthesis/export protein
MKRNVLSVVLLFSLPFFLSCKSYKDLILFSDLTNNRDLLQGYPINPPEYQIKKQDNLYVSILSQNPEMNLLFNPAMGQIGSTSAATGTGQMYGELSSQYINGYQVDQKGNINLPFLGAINVEGATIQAAEARIKARALDFLKEPSIKVKLLNFRVTILGEVNAPGTYYNYDKSISVVDAISMARGITDFAEINKVLVMRKTDRGTQTFRLNLQQSHEVLNSEAFYLQPDDIVYLEPGKIKNTRLNSQSYLLVISGITTLVLILNLINNVKN